MDAEDTTLATRPQTAVEQREEKAVTRFTSYLDRPEVRQRFIQMMGERDAARYINEVLLAVLNNEKLQQCSPKSVYVSALRAAALRLSVDPSTRQAYLVPFDNEATLIVGYKGLQDMCVRTNKYTYIPNVYAVYEGEEVTEDPYTGFHRLGGQRTGKNVVGYLGSFELRLDPKSPNRIGKTFYMTVDEIHAHAQRHSKAYHKKDGAWTTDTRLMERKTVLRLMITRYGYLDPSDESQLREAETDDELAPAAPPDFSKVTAELEKREEPEEVQPPAPPEPPVQEGEVTPAADKKAKAKATVDDLFPPERLPYNDQTIVHVVAGVRQIKAGDALMQLIEAHKSGVVADKLTQEQARVWAKTK